MAVHLIEYANATGLKAENICIFGMLSSVYHNYICFSIIILCYYIKEFL